MRELLGREIHFHTCIALIHASTVAIEDGLGEFKFDPSASILQSGLGEVMGVDGVVDDVAGYRRFEWLVGFAGWFVSWLLACEEGITGGQNAGLEDQLGDG